MNLFDFQYVILCVFPAPSFRGEATSSWNPYVTALQDIKKIPASAMEVLNTGCICLDALCTKSECPPA